jgi:hypothetical protein
MELQILWAHRASCNPPGIGALPLCKHQAAQASSLRIATLFARVHFLLFVSCPQEKDLTAKRFARTILNRCRATAITVITIIM